MIFVKVAAVGADKSGVETFIVGLVLAGGIGIAYAASKGALSLLLRATGMAGPLK